MMLRAGDVALDRIAALSDADRDELRVLSQAVYPPKESANWSGAALEWSPADWCVRVRGNDGALLSYIGITLRDARHEAQPARVGGIGGVKTHPAARRRGLAARGMQRAIEFFHERGVDFGLLVCAPHLLAYYGNLGWHEFTGRLIVRQRGATVDFTYNRVMTCGIRASAPHTGTIDLLGPPW